MSKSPKNPDLLASIFRAFHTLKGTAGFLAFTKLEHVAHQTENLLSQLREGTRPLTPSLVSATLKSVDVVRQELGTIEVTGSESPERHTDLLRLLEALAGETDGDSAGEPEPEMEVTRQGSTAVDKAPVEATSTRSQSADSTIRVDVKVLDRLMNRIGELVLARNEIVRVTRDLGSAVQGSSQRLHVITSQLQEDIMRARMQPVHMLWNKMPRLVRDVASTSGKQIQLQLDGGQTELDRTILEALRDPLVHMVRNAGDHGIEPPEERRAAGKPVAGLLRLRAMQAGSQILIELSDDGRGMNLERIRAKAVRLGLVSAEQAAAMEDKEALRLVCHPGFSTAETVTSLSGRGVGMDVVKTNVEAIGGTLELESTAGQGTLVRIRVPLTLAILPGLVVKSGGLQLVIPQANLVEMIRVPANSPDLQMVQDRMVYSLRGGLLAVESLAGLLGQSTSCETNQSMLVVVVKSDRARFGIVVDEVGDTEEIVVKPLSRQLKRLYVYSGGTVLGDGSVALILDVNGLARRCRLSLEDEAAPEAEKRPGTDGIRQTMLLLQAGKIRRAAIPLTAVERLEEIPRERLEFTDGSYAIQQRGKILRLFRLADVIAPETEELTPWALDGEPLTVVVVGTTQRPIGMVVDEILDTITDTVKSRARTTQTGLLCSAVVGGEITDLLDIPAILNRFDPSWSTQRSQKRTSGRSILVADRSAFTRGVLRHYLELAGHNVLQAATTAEIERRLAERPSALVMAQDMLSEEWNERLASGAVKSPPTVVLTDSVLDQPAEPPSDVLDYQQRFDWKAMLRSLDRMLSA